jgi:hypothetical protein
MPSQLRLVRLGGEAFSLDIPLYRTNGERVRLVRPRSPDTIRTLVNGDLKDLRDHGWQTRLSRLDCALWWRLANGGDAEA